MSDNNLCLQTVSGVTPETTHGTRVLPYYSCVAILLGFKLFPLTRNLVEKNRRRRAHIERVHRGWHGNGHRFIARFQHGCRNAIALAAEDDAAIAGEIRLRKRFAIGVRMRRNATDTAGAKVLQAFNERLGRGVRLGGEQVPLAEFRQFDDRQLQNCAHGIAHGAAQERAAGSFANDQRLDAEGDAVAHQRAQVFRRAKRAGESSRRQAGLDTWKSR